MWDFDATPAVRASEEIIPEEGARDQIVQWFLLIRRETALLTVFRQRPTGRYPAGKTPGASGTNCGLTYPGYPSSAQACPWALSWQRRDVARDFRSGRAVLRSVARVSSHRWCLSGGT